MPHSKTGAPREARRPSYTNSRDRSLMSYILKEPTIEQARENSAAIQGLSSSDVSAANSVASTQDPSEASTPELEYFHMRDVSANRRHSTDDKKPKKNGGSLGGVAEGEGEDPPSPPGPRTATGFPAPKSKKNKALPKKMNTAVTKIAAVNTIKKIALTDEEAAMNGAPEGELFNVELLERGDVAAFPSDDEALAALSSVAKDIKTVDAWHLQFELLTTIRRLALHHPDTMDKKTCSSVLVPFVTEKARSARSSVARNGLMALDDMAYGVGANLLDKACAASIADTLLESTASNQPKIIRATAIAALESCAQPGPLCVALTPALASKIDHKNKDVQTNSMHFAHKCCQSMTAEQIKDELNYKAFLPSLHTGVAVSKSPEAKKAARGACAALVAELGDGEFQSRVASHLPKSSADAFASAGKDEEKKSAKKAPRKKFVPPPKPVKKESIMLALPTPPDRAPSQPRDPGMAPSPGSLGRKKKAPPKLKSEKAREEKAQKEKEADAKQAAEKHAAEMRTKEAKKKEAANRRKQREDEGRALFDKPAK